MASCPLALVGGAITALTDNSFDKGFEAVVGPAIGMGEKFGEKHGKTVAKAVVKSVVFIGVGGVIHGAEDAFTGHPPDKPGS
jgi:hypothetical protein